MTEYNYESNIENRIDDKINNLKKWLIIDKDTEEALRAEITLKEIHADLDVMEAETRFPRLGSVMKEHYPGVKFGGIEVTKVRKTMGISHKNDNGVMKICFSSHYRKAPDQVLEDWMIYCLTTPKNKNLPESVTEFLCSTEFIEPLQDGISLPSKSEGCWDLNKVMSGIRARALLPETYFKNLLVGYADKSITGANLRVIAVNSSEKMFRENREALELYLLLEILSIWYKQMYSSYIPK